jgi:hypothetical protein
MAARRLVIVMIVLLGLSTLAAALVPTPEGDSPPSGATDTVAPDRDAGPEAEPVAAGGEVRAARIRIGDGSSPAVEVHPGDQLRLVVSGMAGEDVAIPAFGLTETMTPYSPARFDLFVDRAGSFPILAGAGERIVGRIVARACEARPRAPRGSARARACAPGDRGAAKGRGRSARQP